MTNIGGEEKKEKNNIQGDLMKVFLELITGLFLQLVFDEVYLDVCFWCFCLMDIFINFIVIV